MKIHSIILASAFSFAMAACTSVPSEPRAMAELKSTTGNTANGTVNFAQNGNKVMVTGEVRGLKPNAEHGFHIHEKGDCSSGDGMSAAGHFNPDGKPHGSQADNNHHAGDLPALKADANGVAKFNFESTSISVAAAATAVAGKGLIVHISPDDYKTQPTGNSGARLACAVIASI